MIIQRIKGYDFTDLKTMDFDKYCHCEDSLILKIKMKKLPDRDRVLFELPATFKISQRYINAKDEAALTPYEKGECYLQYADCDGFVPVIEVELCFVSEHKEWKNMKLGIPLTLYDITEKELYVVYDGVYFNLVYDNKVINYNLPYGKLQSPEKYNVYCDLEYLDYLEYSTDIKNAKQIVIKETVNKKFNYYTPYGYNTFIGDVANFYYNGVYHMLYMPDTHHHGNRWGCGAHHFEHMITKDFVTWEDVGSIWDVDAQWRSVGTGTMFYHKGKYYVSYGLHTSRMIEQDKLFLEELKEYYEKNKKSMVISIDEILKKGKYPIGTSFAVSDDGINFKRSGIISNVVENPSVYSDGNKLTMFSGGKQWESEAMDKPWKIVREGFPPHNDDSKLKNTEECPSFFEWNGYKYLIMGFTGFWHTEKGGDEYIDYAAKGYDIYDGLMVPMAVKTEDNRAIIAGWIGGVGWASCVVHRELVQLNDGQLGMKWIPECFPDIKHIGVFRSNHFVLPEIEKSYYIDINVNLNSSEKFAVRFKDKEEEECELLLDLKNCQMQFATVNNGQNNGFCDRILPIHEMELGEENKGCYGANLKLDNVHFKTRDFAITNVDFSNGEINLRIMLHYNKKMNSTVIDAELNKRRTILSNRVGFFPESVSILKENDCIVNSAECYFADI